MLTPESDSRKTPRDEEKCPRCEGPLYGYPEDRGAGSRVVAERHIVICSACGTDEAIRDSRGDAPVLPGEWPIAGGPRYQLPRP
ncbi:hypothetical protein [Streptomyces noursei]